MQASNRIFFAGNRSKRNFERRKLSPSLDQNFEVEIAIKISKQWGAVLTWWQNCALPNVWE